MSATVESTPPIALDRIARPSAKALQLPPTLTFEFWQGLGRQIGVLGNASPWWIGDWLAYGERNYGSRYRDALEVLHLDYQTLRNYSSVASRFPLYRRRDKLSFQHHAEVVSLSQSEQDLWLNLAESRGWSRNALRRQIRERSGRKPLAEARIPLTIALSDGRRERYEEAALAVGLALADWAVAALDSASA